MEDLQHMLHIREAVVHLSQIKVRILHVLFLNQKSLFTTGKSYTDLFERQLHQMLKEDDGLLPTRGVERYALKGEAGVEELFEILTVLLQM